MFTTPTIDMVKTGQNIVTLRKKAGLSVKDLQDAFGFGTPQAIYKWQRGESMPTIDNLYALSTLFETSVDGILRGSREEDERSSSFYVKIVTEFLFFRLKN